MSSGGGATSPLAGNELAHLKQKVKEKLNELGVEKEIHELVSVKGKSTLTKAAPVITKEAAIEALKERGVLEQLVKSLGTVRQPIARTTSDELLKRNKRVLHIRFGAGENLQPYVNKPPEQHEHLVLCAELSGQRFRSLPITPSAAPAFETTFIVDVPGSATASDVSLLSIRQQLHLVLLRTYPHDPALHTALAGQEYTNLETEVLGTGRCDWREALTLPGQPVPLAADMILGGTWDAKGGAVVICKIAVQLKVHGISNAVEEGELRKKQDTERASDAAALARYYQLAQASPAPTGVSGFEGLLALLAHMEDCSLLPVCTFVKPLHLGRALASPGEACQFVHLLEPRLEVEEDVYAGNVGESWSSLHTIIASGLATPDEKALLLCGMLLGFCLDAWVAVGTHKHAPKDRRLWVLTRGGANQVTFWDPVTGRRFSPSSIADGKPCPFLGIAFVFSHRRLYVNRQTGLLVAQTSFAFEDSSTWRDLNVQPQDLPALPCPRFDLHVHGVDVHALEASVEADLRKLLSEHRKGLGLANTAWDDSLAFQLMPQLAAFEQEAMWGLQACSSQDFEQAIRRAVPPSSVFKGFPQHHRFVSPPRILRALMREPAAVEILQVSAPEAVFALRVKITAYPERVFSLWLMLALRTQDGILLPVAEV